MAGDDDLASNFGFTTRVGSYCFQEVCSRLELTVENIISTSMIPNCARSDVHGSRHGYHLNHKLNHRNDDTLDEPPKKYVQGIQGLNLQCRLPLNSYSRNNTFPPRTLQLRFFAIYLSSIIFLVLFFLFRH